MGDPVLTTAKATLGYVTDELRSTPADTAASQDTDRPTYDEKLTVPWWWYIAGFFVGLLLAAEIALALNGWLALIPVVVVVPGAIALVWKFSSGRLRIANTTLTVGDLTLDLSEVAQAIVLTPDALRRLVGRHHDPMAVVFIRSWIGPGVQFVLQPNTGDELEHPGDRVPYWVVSTRHPERLAAVATSATR